MRRLYLVRHGKAGDRDRFSGPDRDRPLTPGGRRQATQLVKVLNGKEASPDRLLSSPAKRCRETIGPLAKRLRLDIEQAEWLDEGSDAVEAIRRLAEIDDAVVTACTHGDVIWGVLEWLARGGVELGPRPDAPKASSWVLDWPDSPAEGVPIRASFLPPPPSRRSDIA